MSKVKRIKFTSAHAIALLALFVALGGSVYAAGRAAINGKAIKAGSIPANRLKKNSVGGAQINEGSLATVPSAAKAGEAAKAAEAERAGLAVKANEATKAAEATKAGTATNADHATKADRAALAERATNADDAMALGGVPAIVLTQPCLPSGIRGAIRVNLHKKNAPPIQEVDHFTCNGEQPTVTEEKTGTFHVDFPNLPNDQIAVISDIKPGLYFDVAGASGTGFTVTESEAGGQLTNAEDQFSLIVF